jgi:uncharacterized protein
MPFQILCLSGGGFLGLYSISLLAAIEEQFGAPLAAHFDLIAGTSVGGIIALGLAAEVPAQAIKRAFEQNGGTIFSDRNPPTTKVGAMLDVFRSLRGPKYEADALRSTIERIIGKETKLGDLKHPCIIPTVCLTKGGPQLFKTDHHVNFRRDYRLHAVDVALATSAAPTYFPIAEIDDQLYVDGGLYANAPDLLALHEAEHFFKADVNVIRMLSIGTTTSNFSFAHTSGRHYGLWKWASNQRLVRAMISSQQQIAELMAGHRLGDRYLRLDLSQSPEQERSLSLDAASDDAQRTIRAMASVTSQASTNSAILSEMMAHIAPQPIFHHRRVV